MTSSRVPGALSGPLAGASFVAGVAGAVALSDSPYPRPGAPPADVRRYFRGNPRRGVGQRGWPVGLRGLPGTVHRVGGEVGRAVEARLARAANRSSRWRHAGRRVACDVGAVRGGAHRQPGRAGCQRRRPAPADVRRRGAGAWRRLRGAGRRPWAGRAAHRRATPAAGDRRPSLGDGGTAIAALLRNGSRGLVRARRAVLGVGGQRHRRGPARPPLPHLVGSATRSAARSTSVAGMLRMGSDQLVFMYGCAPILSVRARGRGVPRTSVGGAEGGASL